jgi:hypothetical protein
MHELKQGWNFFWVMPPLKGEDECFVEVQQHRLCVCPKVHSDGEKPCMVCKELTKRSRKGDTDFVDEMRLKSRGFMNAVFKHLLKKKDPDNVKILPVSAGVLREIAEHMADEDLDIADPTSAILLGIKRKGEKMATRYKVKFATEGVNIEKYLTDEVLEAMFDLRKARCTQPASTKELRKLIRGAADEDDDDTSMDFDDDDLEDDDLDDDDDDSEEDELLDEPDDDDEDDDSDDDEDEDDDDPDEDDDEDSDDDDDDGDDDEDDDDEDEEEEKRKRKRKKDKKAKVDKKAKKGGKGKGKKKRKK